MGAYSSGYDAGGGYAGVSWGFPGTNNGEALVSVGGSIGGTSIGGGAYGSATTYIGYNSSVGYSLVAYYGGQGNDLSDSGTAYTGSPPPPPPSAPAPPTNLSASDLVTSVVLSWTASAGGATGYEVSRNSSVLTNQSNTSYTDSSPPTRPITYAVRAYNSNASGTAYSDYVYVTVSQTKDSVGILIG